MERSPQRTARTAGCRKAHRGPAAEAGQAHVVEQLAAIADAVDEHVAGPAGDGGAGAWCGWGYATCLGLPGPRANRVHRGARGTWCTILIDPPRVFQSGGGDPRLTGNSAGCPAVNITRMTSRGQLHGRGLTCSPSGTRFGANRQRRLGSLAKPVRSVRAATASRPRAPAGRGGGLMLGAAKLASSAQPRRTHAALGRRCGCGSRHAPAARRPSARSWRRSKRSQRHRRGVRRVCRSGRNPGSIG